MTFNDKLNEKQGQRRKRFLEFLRSFYCQKCHKNLALHENGTCPKGAEGAA
jgi:hypothetical protein